MVPEVVSKDMYAYLKRNTRLVLSVESEEGGQEHGDATEPEPSSGTKHKQAKKKATQAAISSFVVSAHPTQNQKSGK